MCVFFCRSVTNDETDWVYFFTVLAIQHSGISLFRYFIPFFDDTPYIKVTTQSLNIYIFLIQYKGSGTSNSLLQKAQSILNQTR